MTFTARLLIALSGAEILFICCGRILRASSPSQSSAQKMIQIIALTVTSSRTDGLKWFYRPMKTMSLSLHFLLSFTNVWLMPCSSCWGLRAQRRVLFIYSQVVTSSSFHHKQVRFIFTPVWRKWCDRGCHQLSRTRGRGKMAARSPLPLEEAQIPTLAYLISTLETISKPTICLLFY